MPFCPTHAALIFGSNHGGTICPTQHGVERGPVFGAHVEIDEDVHAGVDGLHVVGQRTRHEKQVVVSGHTDV